MNHIKNSCENDKAWCGETLDVTFYFKDAEAAAINGLMRGKLVPCMECITAIARCLHYDQG